MRGGDSASSSIDAGDADVDLPVEDAEAPAGADRWKGGGRTVAALKADIAAPGRGNRVEATPIGGMTLPCIDTPQLAPIPAPTMP
jgi:hypothetical protein